MITTELTPFGSTPSSTQLQAAAAILEQRFRSFAGSTTAVPVSGQHLVVQAGSDVTQALPSLIGPGNLTFRRVVEDEVLGFATPASAGSSQVASGDVYTPAAYASLQCQALASVRAPVDAPGQEIVACSIDRKTKFHLAIAKVFGRDVKSASAASDPTSGTELVNLAFKGSGQDRWTNLTKEAFGQSAPTNQAAITLDGVVVSAPTIQGVINGDAQISGSFTQVQAKALASTLRYGALPVAFSVEP